MKNDRYLQRPRERVRRKDRVLDDEAWIAKFLDRAPFGHLALCWEGRPLIHTNLFLHEDGRIFGHTAGTGRMPAMLEHGALEGCFSASEQGRILPAATPLDFSTEYASVVLYGRVSLVEDRAKKRLALEGIMAKYAPHLAAGVDYAPMPDADVDSTHVWCLLVESRVAKHNIKPDDYPAYAYSSESFIDQERAAGRLTMRAKELA